MFFRKNNADLIDASKDGDLEKARRSLEKGANVNVKNILGVTPLIFASSRGHEDIVSLLLEKGADVNAKTYWGCGQNAPLHNACSEGHRDVMLLLLRNGADANIQNEVGFTPLHFANRRDVFYRFIIVGIWC
jgi:tankyrase